MSKIKPGDVVIVTTNQAGTVWWILDGEVAVMLRNKDIWYGKDYEARIPSSKEELEACVVDLEKWQKSK